VIGDFLPRAVRRIGSSLVYVAHQSPLAVAREVLIKDVPLDRRHVLCFVDDDVVEPVDVRNRLVSDPAQGWWMACGHGRMQSTGTATAFGETPLRASARTCRRSLPSAAPS